MATAEDYAKAFADERARTYPVIDDLERRVLPADALPLPRERLERMARILACPVKARAPNWQHGRVIYAVAMQYLRKRVEDDFLFCDIGTAKGFSALCLAWALNQSNRSGEVVSFDVIDPLTRVPRNSPWDLNEPIPNVDELVTPFRPAAVRLHFVGFPAPGILSAGRQRRIGVAFVDGKHTRVAVASDSAAVARRQQRGDVIIFDDLQIDGVARGVEDLRGYKIEWINASPERGYAIATKQ